MERLRRRRSLRLAFTLSTAVAGCALVGWGGLSAWQAYTVNAGNQVAAGTLAHSNGASCVSLLGTIPTSSGTGWCSAAVTISGVDPANWTGTTGTIAIANTGSLQSTFALSMGTGAQTPTGGLCADVTLQVTDPNHAAPDSTGQVWAATALTGTFTAANLYNNAATPSLTWTGGGAQGSGSGATGDTFTVTVAPGAGFNTHSTDAGTSCSFGLLFTQTAA
ncbi:MAG TPA: hypothetical protein VEK76_10005 [Candidatus Binatia bacterium]|nr:hypothetical protein [Candidatus Binatia bacterium]